MFLELQMRGNNLIYTFSSYIGILHRCVVKIFFCLAFSRWGLCIPPSQEPISVLRLCKAFVKELPLKSLYVTCLDPLLPINISTLIFSSEAGSTCFANLNHYYSFLLKLIPYTVYKHRKNWICMTKCRAGFATANTLSQNCLMLIFFMQASCSYKQPSYWWKRVSTFVRTYVGWVQTKSWTSEYHTT